MMEKGKKWTDAEKHAFKRALEKHAWGNWKVISQEMTTRTSDQVKSHAQKYARKHPEEAARYKTISPIKAHYHKSNSIETKYKFRIPPGKVPIHRPRPIKASSGQAFVRRVTPTQEDRDMILQDVEAVNLVGGNYLQPGFVSFQLVQDARDPQGSRDLLAREYEPSIVQINDKLGAKVNWNDEEEVEILPNNARKQFEPGKLMRKRLNRILEKHLTDKWWLKLTDFEDQFLNLCELVAVIVSMFDNEDWIGRTSPEEMDDVLDVAYKVNMIWHRVRGSADISIVLEHGHAGHIHNVVLGINKLVQMG
jgi:SHAQKYF class myb-like DNA-binding protein